MNEAVNAIRGIVGTMEESEFVGKVMRMLSKSYKPKKFSIKESHYMDKYTLDQLIGVLSSFKISKPGELCNEKKEATFKVTKKIEDEPESSNADDMDEVEEKFVRRLKKGS